MPLFPRRCRRRRCERVVLPTNDDDDEEALALVAIVAILYLSLSRVLKRRARGGQTLSLSVFVCAVTYDSFDGYVYNKEVGKNAEKRTQRALSE